MAIFITDSLANSVLGFDGNAAGNVAPLYSLVGSSTQLAAPSALITAGVNWVADSATNSVSVFDPLQAWNAPPESTLSGANTGLIRPGGVAINFADDILYVANYSGAITAYPARAQGNTAPLATTQGRPGYAGACLDVNGNLYVANPIFHAVDVYRPAQIGGGLTLLTRVQPFDWDRDMNRPFGVCIADYNGQVGLYVAEQRGRVAVYSVNTLLAQPGVSQAPPVGLILGNNTLLQKPCGVAVDFKTQEIFVADAVGTILAFPAGANGNVAPARTISGPATTLQSPVSISIGDIAASPQSLYATMQGANAVNVWPLTANGNALPTRTLSGPATLLNAPTGIAVDGAGAIYVTNIGPNAASVTVYPAGANGNVAPARVIQGANTQLAEPWGIAVDGAGNIFVSNVRSQNINVYKAGRQGNVAPDLVISDPRLAAVLGIAVDAKGNLYVGPESGLLLTFSVNLNALTYAVTGTVQGNKTLLASNGGVALDPNSDVYACQLGFTAGGPQNVVLVFAAGANGNVAPKVALADALSPDFAAWCIALDQHQNVFLGSADYGGLIWSYSATGFGTLPLRTLIATGGEVFGIAVA